MCSYNIGHDSAGPDGATPVDDAMTMLNAVFDRLLNAGCPGFVATDLNGHRGTRTVEQGAAIAITLATLPDGGPTGTYSDDAGPIPW